MGMGTGGYPAHQRAPLGRHQPVIRRLGDHRPAVQRDLFLPPAVHGSSVHAGYGGTGGMKRRLPTTRKSELLLAAISLPPLTDDANRHTPTASHPGRQAAAPNAAPTAASANPPASAAGPITWPPSSTASAANATPSSGARPANRRTHPRAVVYGTPALAAAGRTPRAPPATSAMTMPTVSATSSRQASVNAGSGAWLTRHGAHRSLGTKIFRQRPAART